MVKYIVGLFVIMIALCSRNGIINASSLNSNNDYIQTDSITDVDSLLLSIDTLGITMGFNQVEWYTDDSVIIHQPGDILGLSTYLFANDVELVDKFVYSVVDSAYNIITETSVLVSEMDTIYNEVSYRTENSFMFYIGEFEFQENMQVDVRLVDSLNNQVDSILIPVKSY